MISHEYQCVFIHIPKCAGTSIEKAFGHFDEYNGRGRQDHRTLRMYQPYLPLKAFFDNQNRYELYKKIKRKIYTKQNVNPKNKRVLDRYQYENYFKFTVVRNPWDRIVSWYKGISKDNLLKEKYGLNMNDSFEYFVKNWAGKKHLKQQMYWIRDFNGVVDLDYIIRFENLEEGFNEVKKCIGVDNIKLPHELKTKKDDYRKFYDDYTRDLVREIYKEEIVLFNYRFE